MRLLGSGNSLGDGQAAFEVRDGAGAVTPAARQDAQDVVRLGHAAAVIRRLGCDQRVAGERQRPIGLPLRVDGQAPVGQDAAGRSTTGHAACDVQRGREVHLGSRPLPDAGVDVAQFVFDLAPGRRWPVSHNAAAVS